MSELIDNRAKRIREMKRLIRQLHQGENTTERTAEVTQQFKAIVQHCDAAEVAAMEQELLAEGIAVHELMQMCDLHSQVVSDLLVERRHDPIEVGHPVDVFRRENVALQEHATRLRAHLAALVEGRPETASLTTDHFRAAREDFNALMDVEKHYARKENLLFPVLERYGITGPSTVMWGKDDEVRALLRSLGETLEVSDVTVGEWRLASETVGVPALDALEEMIRKEERILLPLALQTLNAWEWGEIWNQSPEIGWCLIDPDGPYRAPAPENSDMPASVSQQVAEAGVALHAGPPDTDGAIVFPTGSLNLGQLKGLFGVLPVDLTFVDADDRVRFFSEGEKRVFVRPKTIIGRKVEHCHPPSSVHVVAQILSDFRSGRQSVAEFWIEHGGRFIHIRYFAVRDEEGTYLGTLEVTQDLTHARQLTGQRRLLAYD